MIDLNQRLSLTLTAAQINLVFAGLQRLQFRRAAPVIAEIEGQVRAQAPSAFETAEAPKLNGYASAADGRH